MNNLPVIEKNKKKKNKKQKNSNLQTENKYTCRTSDC